MKPSDLLKITGHVVAYHPRLAGPLGSVNASILFSQLYYWSDKTDSDLGVYKTAAEIEHETGLTAKEQETARKKLKSSGVLIETHKRLIHRIYYKIDFDAFNALMANVEIDTPETQKGDSGDAKKEMDEPQIVDSYKGTLDYQKTTALDLVDSGKAKPANNVDSDEPTRSPRSTATENKKRFDGLAKVFNQVFAECNQVTKVSPQAKTVNKKRIALVPQAWSFGKERVTSLAELGLIPEANANEVLAWFQRYFEICRDDPFINGTQPRGKGHENWKASFEYLMKITEIEKRILEGE